MMALSFIDPTIVPLKLSDSSAFARFLFNSLSVRHLPVVQDNICIGILSAEDIKEEKDLPNSLPVDINHNYSFVSENNHIYEVMRVISAHSLTVIPVLDQHNQYKGCISLHSLLKNYVNCAAFLQPGSVVVLEMDIKNYSLSEIASIVESENKAILSSLLSSSGDSNRIEITLKLNSVQIQHLLATFERFGYYIKATFNEENYLDTLMDRYESLMTYLNV
jgi:predicted transcriptional regulator